MSHLKGALAEEGKLYAVKCIAINEYIICASSPQTVKIQVKLQKHNTHTKKIVANNGLPSQRLQKILGIYFFYK